MNNPVVYFIVGVAIIVGAGALLYLAGLLHRLDPQRLDDQRKDLQKQITEIFNMLKALEARIDKKMDDHQLSDDNSFRDLHRRINDVREIVSDETGKLYDKFIISHGDLSREITASADRLFDRLDRADRRPTGGNPIVKGDKS